MRYRGVFLIIVGLCLVVPAVGELTVFEGDGVVVNDANLSLTWGQEFTFDATGSSMVGDVFSLEMVDGPDQNISITSNTSEQLNATLWEYDFSDIAVGDELIRVEVEAVPDSNVTVTFTGVPDISDGSYRVYRDGGLYETFDTGGTLDWSDTDWSAHNYSVMYEKPFFAVDITDSPDTVTAGDTATITADITNTIEMTGEQYITVSADSLVADNRTVALDAGASTTESLSWNTSGVSPGTYTVSVTSEDTTDTVDIAVGSESDSSPSTRPPTPDHCWRGTDTSFARDDPAAGLLQIGVDTAEDAVGPCLAVNASDQQPEGIEMLDDVYRYYTFTPEGLSSEDITTVTLTVAVNTSFTEQYEDITVKRYQDRWQDMGATLVDATDDTRVYETTTDGFSHYAVTGIAPHDDEEPDDTDTDPDPPENGENGDDPDPGEDEYVDDLENETAPGTPGDGPDRSLLLIGTGIVILLSGFCAAVFAGYRYWQYRVEQELFELANTVDKQIDRMQDLDRERQIIDALTAAENAFEENRLRTATNHVQDVKSLLAQD